jgi:hypothetical protein
MRNITSLLTLAIALGLIVYLYSRMSRAERELATIQRRAADCEQVTFQLQNQLSQYTRKSLPATEATTESNQPR